MSEQEIIERIDTDLYGVWLYMAALNVPAFMRKAEMDNLRKNKNEY